MKYDVTKIEGYADMTAEEKVAALEAVEVDIPDVKKLREALDKATSEAAENKRKWKETLSEAEKNDLESKERAKKLDERLAEFEKKEAIETLTRRYMSLGFTEDEAVKAAENHNSNDLNAVFEALGNFITEAKKTAVAEKIKEVPAPKIGDPDKKVTRSVKDLSLKELQEIYNKDREEFNTLT